MKFHRNIIWLIPLILFVTFPLWSVPVGKFLTPRGGFDPALKERKATSRTFTLDTVKILQNQDGVKTALIRAQRARTGKTPDSFIMESVDADIFDADGSITNIVAKTGEYDTITQLLTLIDDVVVNRKVDKQFLYTDLLHYDSTQRTINCPGQTRLEGEDVTIDGGSLDYDINSRSYVIGKRVKTVLNGFVEQP